MHHVGADDRVADVGEADLAGSVGSQQTRLGVLAGHCEGDGKIRKSYAIGVRGGERELLHTAGGDGRDRRGCERQESGGGDESAVGLQRESQLIVAALGVIEVEGIGAGCGEVDGDGTRRGRFALVDATHDGIV